MITFELKSVFTTILFVSDNYSIRLYPPWRSCKCENRTTVCDKQKKCYQASLQEIQQRVCTSKYFQPSDLRTSMRLSMSTFQTYCVAADYHVSNQSHAKDLFLYSLMVSNREELGSQKQHWFENVILILNLILVC